MPRRRAASNMASSTGSRHNRRIVAICVIGLRMVYAVRSTVACCSGVSTGDATTLIFTPFADVTLS
jgi:hypothetical protein